MKKNNYSQDFMNYKIKILPVVVYLLIVLSSFLIFLTDNSLTTIQIFGFIITLVGFGLWILARIQLGNAFSVNPKATALVTTGLYSKTRHPVYVFSFIAFLGITLFFKSILLFSVLIIVLVFQLYRIRQEEKVLYKKFGKEYLTYKKSTWF